MTAYGGLLPVATMLEELRFQQLIEEDRQVLGICNGHCAEGREGDL